VAATSRTFVDTNILVYAHDASDPAKQRVARIVLERLWELGTGAISTQILQEFYVVATRKLEKSLSRADARLAIEVYSTWHVVVIEPALIIAATRVEEEHALSLWDALVVEAARVAGAERLLTEDLTHGQVIAGVLIENPFVVGASA
jgi:predicted nucleic acid-binding protein